MGNYPEGVTGLEWQISGPTRSYTANRLVSCDRCDRGDEIAIDIDYYSQDGAEFGTWACAQCGHENEYEHYPQFDWSPEDDY